MEVPFDKLGPGQVGRLAYQVLGQDAAISQMVAAGQLELNVMMPAIGSALFDAMDWITNAINAVVDRNLQTLEIDRQRCRDYAHASVGLATLLNTVIGYAKAAEVAKESEKTGRPVRELVAEKGLMQQDEFDKLVEQAAREGNITNSK